MTERLNQLGIRTGQSRSVTLFQLATDLPAAILAEMLGIHITVAVSWQRASGDWAVAEGEADDSGDGLGVEEHEQPGDPLLGFDGVVVQQPALTAAKSRRVSFRRRAQRTKFSAPSR